ncbi:MAG: bifunctional DNA primase/polymerase [Candidatus Peribacteraceae bacterium]|nr:bifunctional DNA primase/polymerase [Candidatus Peribacteraceae bacterium]
MDNPNDLLIRALNYLEMGWPVIPVNQNKRPRISSWKEYQERMPTTEEVTRWFNDPGAVGMALITGRQSGTVVLDVEKEGLDELQRLEIPQTVVAVSGGGGRHIYFKHPGFEVSNMTKMDGVPMDIRGDGGYIILPPSLHASGNHYLWATGPGDVEIAEMPTWLLKRVQKTGLPTSIAPNVSKKTKFDFGANVPEGSRNTEAAKAIGAILCRLEEQEFDSKGWSLADQWNTAHCEPPLEEQELRVIFESIKKSHIEQLHDLFAEKKKPKESKAKRLLNYVDIAGAELFHNQSNEPLMRVTVNGHQEIFRCSHRTERCKRYLTKLFWDNEKASIKVSDLQEAADLLGARAFHDSPMRELSNRVARHDGAIFYDLSDKEWRAVRITQNGWEVLANPPILFAREEHQLPQVEPLKSGGNAKKILEYINIAKPEHKLLYLVQIISYFIPNIPHPVAVFHGKPGSAKSTATKMTKMLVDPSQMEAFTLSRDEAQMVQQLSHHYLGAYDNIDYLNPEQSDALCRAVTGGGFSKRALYSDDDDKIYHYRRCIVLNGVSQASTRTDLLDRSTLFELERIPDDVRLTERELWENFRKDLPVILGGVFDVIAEAMRLQPTVKLVQHPRMADFAEWGCAIALALGYTQEEFESSINLNKKDQHETVLSEDAVASSLLKFMANHGESWQGTATDLLIHLEDNGLRGRRLPTANALSRRLNLIGYNLEAAGIKFERGYKDNQRLIILTKIPSVSSESIPEKSDDKNRTDDTDDENGALKRPRVVY